MNADLTLHVSCVMLVLFLFVLKSFGFVYTSEMYLFKIRNPAGYHHKYLNKIN